jgi:hypothetical protein
MDGGEEPVSDEETKRQLRAKAREIYRRTMVLTAGATVLTCLLA